MVVGQALFAVGLQGRSSGWALVGRLLLGIGGESLGVAQARITAKWFMGNELALSTGVNLAVARLGSVANDLISPALAIRYSIPLALQFGFLTCLFSFLCTVVLVILDTKYEHESPENRKQETVQMTDFGRPPSRIGESSRNSFNAKEVINAMRSFPRCFWLVCLILFFLYGTGK